MQTITPKNFFRLASCVALITLTWSNAWAVCDDAATDKQVVDCFITYICKDCPSLKSGNYSFERQSDWISEFCLDIDRPLKIDRLELNQKFCVTVERRAARKFPELWLIGRSRKKDMPKIDNFKVEQGTRLNIAEDGKFFPVTLHQNLLRIVGKSRIELKTSSQVAATKWKVLAISLPDTFFRTTDLEELSRFPFPDDPTLARLYSGRVWHAIFGKRGTQIYSGIEEHLAAMKINRFTYECEADGYLVDPEEPWHAVIVSLFRTSLHQLESQKSTRAGGDVLPLDLSPRRTLFVRKNGATRLQERVMQELAQLVGASKVV